MAFAAYQATGTASSVASGVPTPTLPTHLANDLAVLSITCDPTFDASVATPSGWFVIGAVSNPSVAARINVFGRWLASGSDPNPTIQSFTNFAYAVITTYRGADPSQTLTVVGTQGNNNSANATFNPNLVTDFSEELLVFIVGWGNDSVGPLGGTITNTALLSPATRYNLGTTDGSGGGIVVCDGQLPVAIRVGTLTVQMTTASANATVAFALRSATSVASSPVPVVGNAGASVTTAVVDTQVLFSGTATAGSTAILQIGTPNGVAGDLVAGLEQGFTLLGYAEGTGATNPSRVTLWVKHNIIGGGGDTGPTVKFNSDHFTASIRTFSGVLTAADPIDVVGYSNPTTSSTTGTWPDVTTTVPGCLILNYGSDGADSVANTWTVPANSNLYYVTEAGEVRTATGHGGGVVLITGAQATAGATGATTSTVTNSSGGRITIALRPSLAPVVATASVAFDGISLTADASLSIDLDALVAFGGLALTSDVTVEAPAPVDIPEGILPWIPATARVIMHWQTVVTRTYDGSERRAALATRPFEEIQYTYQLDAEEIRYLRAEFSRAPAQRRMMVMMGHELIVTAAVGLGTNSVTVTTTGLSDCLEVGRDVLLIRRDTRDFHYARVVSKTSTTVTFDNATLATFPAIMTSLYPLAECTVMQPITFARHPSARTAVTIQARRYYVDLNMGTGASALTTYDGRTVLDFREPAVEGTHPEQTDAAVDFVNYGMASESYFSDVGNGVQGVNQRELLFTIPTDAVRQAMRLFQVTVRGRQKAFLLSTRQPDLQVVVQPTGDEIVVEGTYYSGATALLDSPVYEHLMFTFIGGGTTYRTVVAASDNGNGTETLTLNADVNTGVLGAITKISFLELVRLASDDVPWDLASGSMTRVSFPIVGCLA